MLSSFTFPFFLFFLIQLEWVLCKFVLGFVVNLGPSLCNLCIFRCIMSSFGSLRWLHVVSFDYENEEYLIVFSIFNS